MTPKGGKIKDMTVKEKSGKVDLVEKAVGNLRE